MTFAAICVTVACLIIVGSFSLIMQNLDHMVLELEQQNQVLVYIDDSYTEAEAKSVGSEINLIPNVAQAEYVSRQEALDQFVEEQDDPAMFSGLGSDTLRSRFVVTLENSELMEQTVAELEAIQGVAKVNAHLEIANGFTTIRNVLQLVSTAIIVVLLVVSLFSISNTVSAAAAFFAEWGLYDVLGARISQIDTLQLFSAIPFRDVLGVMVAVYVAAGLFVGIFGSLMSIRKFLDV